MKSIKPKDTWEAEDRFGKNETENSKVIGELQVRMKAKLKNARKIGRMIRKIAKSAERANKAIDRQIELTDKIRSYTPIDIDLKMKKT
jgi:hypothetical protein